ncbi:hypothetical protein D3C76_557120 [compost metagenome]
MRRRGAAATADDVQKAAGSELFDHFGHLRRGFVVFTERIWQAGVGVRRNLGVGLVGELLQVRAQFLGAQGAVQADRDRLGVANRVPERFGGLPGQGPPGSIGDGPGDHDRQFDAVFLEHLLHGEDGCLGVEGVEDGFDQDQVGAAFDQAAGRFGVVLYQQVEGDIAKARVVDVRGNRARTAGRAEHAGDKAWLVRGFQGLGITDLAGQAGTFDVQFVHQGFHAVVGLGYLGGVEGVGLEDVRPGIQVGLFDGTDDIRAGQHQQVVVALDVARPVGEAFATVVVLLEAVALDHRAHAAIENQDTLFESLLKSLETSAAVRHRTT